MKKALKIAASYIIVILIALMMAVNYQMFVFPNRFAPAGLNGIFTMIQHVLGIKLSHTTIVLNVPLAIASYFLSPTSKTNLNPKSICSLSSIHAIVLTFHPRSFAYVLPAWKIFPWMNSIG